MQFPKPTLATLALAFGLAATGAAADEARLGTSEGAIEDNSVVLILYQDAEHLMMETIITAAGEDVSEIAYATVQDDVLQASAEPDSERVPIGRFDDSGDLQLGAADSGVPFVLERTGDAPER